MTAASFDQLQSLYIAYFGRPADPAGLQYWFNQKISAKDFASLQFEQPEFQAVNGGLSIQQQINNLYVNLFNRNADDAGLTYWVNQITSGKIQLAQIGVFLTEGALGIDKQTLAAKVAVANEYTRDVLATADSQIAYNPTSFEPWITGPAFTDGRTFLSPVSNTNVPTNEEISAAVAAMTSGGAPGQTFTLTTSQDTIEIDTIGSVDIVQGIVSAEIGTTGLATWTFGDSINGNDLTKVNLTLAGSSVTPTQAAFGVINNVDEINFTNGVTDSEYTFESVDWTNIGSINLVAGASAAFVRLNDLETGTDLTISNKASGIIVANYDNGYRVGLEADRSSTVSFTDGTIDGVVASNETVYAYVTTGANNESIVLGDITLTGSGGAGGYAYVVTTGDNSSITTGDIAISGVDVGVAYVLSTGEDSSVTVGDVEISDVDTGVLYVASNGDNSPIVVGDVAITAASAGNAYIQAFGDDTSVTVGDIAITAEESAYVYVNAFGDNSSVTVGDITTVVGDNSDPTYVYVFNRADLAGDISVGDVSMTGGDDSIQFLNISSTGHTADSGLGNVTVGNISLTSGDTSYASAMYAYVELTGQASIGDLTVGDITITAGDSSTGSVENVGYLNVFAEGNGNGDNDITTGLVSVGDVSYTLGRDTSYIGYISNYALVQSGDATNGGITVGDITTLTAENSTSYVLVYSNAEAALPGGTATVGDTTIGQIDQTVGDFGVQYARVFVSATGNDSGSASIGDISIAGFSASLGVSAEAELRLEVDSDNGSIGSISIGDISTTVTTGGYSYVNIYAEADDNIGDITIGDLDLAVTGLNGEIFAQFDYIAVDGTVGDVSVGNIDTRATAKDANSCFELVVSGETAVGNTTVGDITASSLGANTDAYAYVNIQTDSLGSVGDITVGDVSLTANGSSAQAGFYVQAINAVSTGTITIGDLDLAVGNTDLKTDSEVWFIAENEENSVIVGDISLTGLTVQNAAFDSYNALIEIIANGVGSDVTIGNITVTGGDTIADNFDVLDFTSTTGWLDVTATDKITVGNIDYSGYATSVSGNTVIIDLEGTQGASSIIGSNQLDTITDNKSTNTITGGSGNDTYQFVNTNTGLTLATADKIIGWNAGSEDINIQYTGVGILSYGENIGATETTSFSDFLTNADDSNTSVYVGQVTEGLIAAFDYNDDGGVDSLVLLQGVTGYANISSSDFNTF
jgi:hypothetical protein